uniref:Uncharacterized protein n=1 Tax=Tetranychus urticae TaxID=32264 RepID=T1JZD3_TETUR
MLTIRSSSELLLHFFHLIGKFLCSPNFLCVKIKISFVPTFEEHSELPEEPDKDKIWRVY